MTQTTIDGPEMEGPSEAASNQFALFKTRRFWPLFGVQFLGVFNDQTFKNAFVALLTYRLSDSLAMGEGAVDSYILWSGVLYIIPFALCSPTAGQIADGMDKARMMRFVKFAEIVLMVIAAIAYLTQMLWLLMLLMFLMGAQSAFFAPIKYGILPQYMRRDEMPAANGLVQGATFMAILLGQIVGAKIVLTDGGVVYVSVAVVLIAIAGWLFSFAAPPAPPTGPKPKVDWVMPRAMVRIIAACRHAKEAFFAILALGWFWFAGAVFTTLIFPIAKFSLGASENVALILLTAFSVGVLLGALMYSIIVRGRVTLMTAPWGASGMGVGAILFWLAVLNYAPPTADELITAGAFLARFDAWLVLGALAMMAMFAGLYVTPLNVEYQVKSPEGEKGRFVACSNVVDALCMATSFVIAEILINLVGVPREMMFALVGLTGFAAAYAVYRQARRIERA